MRWAAGFAAAFTVLFTAPAMAAPPLDAYGKLPGVDMAALSPSGSHYAIVGEVEGARRLVVVETGGKPVM
ncbi:MAG TPA: hypothetical protein VFX95_09635, partial [Caulobacteraceae bacterium]|nr:hypothetical protein [Caulobacteraceae bacterium]